MIELTGSSGPFQSVGLHGGEAEPSIEDPDFSIDAMASQSLLIESCVQRIVTKSASQEILEPSEKVRGEVIDNADGVLRDIAEKVT